MGNKGDDYENFLYNKCISKGLIVPGTIRGGGGRGNDLVLDFNAVEVKIDKNCDFGQRKLNWNNIWEWAIKDNISDMFDQLGVLDFLNKKNYIPNSHSKKGALTLQDKLEDIRAFEYKFENVPQEILFNYYANKNCYYIQIKKWGFYYLKEDIFNLGVPAFNCDINIRLRAKTVHSNPIDNYIFLAVLKVTNIKEESPYDLEEDGSDFIPCKTTWHTLF